MIHVKAQRKFAERQQLDGSLRRLIWILDVYGIMFVQCIPAVILGRVKDPAKEAWHETSTDRVFAGWSRTGWNTRVDHKIY